MIVRSPRRHYIPLPLVYRITEIPVVIKPWVYNGVLVCLFCKSDIDGTAGEGPGNGVVNLLGGVVIFHNKPSEIEQQTEYLRKTLDLSPEQFFNSGVLSMNLKLFRDEGTTEKCLVFLREHRQLHWMEQDVLNGVCKDRVYNLPEKWNRSQFYVEDDLAERGAIGDTIIIHYLTDCKPWLVPFRRSHLYFYQYVILTPYKDELTQRLLENNAPAKTSRERILNRVKNLFFQGNTTPIHLFWYAKCWLWGKIRRFIRKLCRV